MKSVKKYSQKDKVKMSARRNRRKFAESLTIEAEKVAGRQDISVVYNITKRLTGNRNGSQDPPLETQDRNSHRRK